LTEFNWQLASNDELNARMFLATLPSYNTEQLMDINTHTPPSTEHIRLPEDKLKTELRAITKDYIHAKGTHQSVMIHFSHIYSLDEIMTQLQTHPNKNAIIEELCREYNIDSRLYESIETWKIIHGVLKAKKILAHLVGGNSHMDIPFMKQTLQKHPDWLSPRDKKELSKYL
jgi:hypothetical protein